MRMAMKTGTANVAQIVALMVAMVLTVIASTPAKTADLGGKTTETANCGGIAGLACTTGSYCNYPASAQCGAADQTGVCRPKPQFCTAQYLPVCGCDSKSYGNSCSAAAQGISVAYDGQCKPEAK